MANLISEQLLAAAAGAPPFGPYPSADMDRAPWIPADPVHVRAQDSWATRTSSGPARQGQSFFSWILAFLRFVLDAHLCDSWAHLGGFIAHLNMLGVIAHPSNADPPNVAMIYASLVVARLARQARGREIGADSHQMLSFESAELRAKAVKEHTTAAETAKKRNDTEKKGEMPPSRDKDKDANARPHVPRKP